MRRKSDCPPFDDRDLKSYQDTVSTFSIPALDERYEFLRQLGNVFLVPAQSLKSFVTESYLGRIDAQLLRPYLAQRSDWNETERGYDGEVSATGAAETSGRGLRERLGVTGKLAAVVRELDNLRVGDEANNGGSASQRNSGAFGLSPSMNLGTV